MPESVPAFPNIPQFELPITLRSPVARLIADSSLGLEAKAYAIDRCHKIFKVCTDKLLHIFRLTTSCHTAYCRGCSQCRAENLDLSHRYLRERMKDMPAKRIYQFILYYAIPRETKAVRRVTAAIGRRLRRFSQGESYIAWWEDKLFIGPNLVVKGIYCGREGDYNFQSLFPDAKVSVRARSSHDIDECFDEMLAPMFPATDEDRAEQEILFHGVQRFRKSASGEYAEFTKDSTSKEYVKSSHGEGSGRAPHAHDHTPRCPHCGGKATKMTGWLTQEEMERILASGEEPPWLPKSPPGAP